MDECCCQTGPPTLQIARAASVISVVCFHSFVFSPLFCGRRWFRRCAVHAMDNGRCGFALPDQDAQAAVPIFASVFTGASDPCSTSETLVPRSPFSANDLGMSCRLAPEFSSLDCWDAGYTYTIESTRDDLIAACLANLSLIDLDQVPFGSERRVVNDIFTGAPVITDSPTIGLGPSAAAACATPNFLELAASFAFEYGTIGTTRHCTSTQDRRIEMPTQQLIVSASRSRFATNSTWCKRALGPIFVDPDFANRCRSSPGPCTESACSYYLAASGHIDLPALNQSVHIGLCASPASPCNQTPIAF